MAQKRPPPASRWHPTHLHPPPLLLCLRPVVIIGHVGCLVPRPVQHVLQPPDLLPLQQDLVLQLLQGQGRRGGDPGVLGSAGLSAVPWDPPQHPGGAGAGPLRPYLRGRELGGDAPVDGGGEELLPQDVPELLGQHLLLLHAAVVLQGQDHRVGRGLGSKAPRRWAEQQQQRGGTGGKQPPPSPPRPRPGGTRSALPGRRTCPGCSPPP